jgi:hypothetical protein
MYSIWWRSRLSNALLKKLRGMKESPTARILT